jgi:protein involved in polysaccharide export with SLBB domain
MKTYKNAKQCGKGLILAGLLAALQLGAAGPADMSMPQGAGQPGTQVDDSVYKIGPQNLLQIRILGEDKLQSTFRVDDNGFITHPLAGRIQLAGKTVADAEDILIKVLDGDYIRNPHITVFVLEHSRFSVLGEVKTPGNYEIIGQVSMMEAISMAGGFTPVANEKKVRILRKAKGGGEQSIEVDVQEIMDGAKEDNVFIQAGDVVNVPKSFF